MRPETEERPEFVTTLYPEEVSAFDKSAEFQGGHWTVMGKETKDIGPSSNDDIINDIMPEMGQYNDEYVSGEVMGLLSQEQKDRFFLDLSAEFPIGVLTLTPMFGVRYRHEAFDNDKALFPRSKDNIPQYPQHDSAEFSAGKRLSKILRHYIGRAGNYQTAKTMSFDVTREHGFF